MKRFLLIALCLFLIIPAAGAAAADEPVEVTWLMLGFGNIAFDNPDLKIYQWMNEVGNIKIKPVVVPEDSYKDKFMVLMAANELPDVIYTDSSIRSIIKEYGPEGVFVPINEHLDMLPAFSSFLKSYSTDAKSLHSVDGKMYMFPSVYLEDTPTYTIGLVLREDLLLAGGMSPADIKTTDDLYHAFEVIYAQNGNKPVISARKNLTNMSYLANVFGTNFSVRYNPETKEFDYPVGSDATFKLIEFLNKMYVNHLLHPDWASMSDTVWEQEVASGELGGFFDNMKLLALRNEDLALSVGENAKLVPILPPSFEGKTYAWAAGAKMQAGNGAAINASVTGKKLEGILKVMNWLYDYEASNVKLHYGEVGATFKYREDGTPEYIVDTDWEHGNGPLTLEYGIGTNICNYHFLTDKWRLFDFAVTPPEGNPLVDALDLYKSVYTYSAPALTFTTDENERLSVLQTPLKTFINENLIQFINGVKPLTDWASFVQQLRDMKIDEVTEIYNTAYHRMYD